MEPAAGAPFQERFRRPSFGVTTKEEADALRGTKLHVARSRLPELPEDEFYNADLVDLLVLDTGGSELGRVTAVLNHGAETCWK